MPHNTVLPAKYTRDIVGSQPFQGPPAPVDVGYPLAPFCLVDFPVFLEELVPVLLIELVEGCRELMVDEHVLCADDTQAGFLHAAAVVVVVEEAPAEGLVHRADAFIG